LYNAKNSVTEEKVKQALGDSVQTVENCVKEGLSWLESNSDATKEQYEERKKMSEDVIKPVMMKLYQDSQGQQQEGPQVSEVD